MSRRPWDELHAELEEIEELIQAGEVLPEDLPGLEQRRTEIEQELDERSSWDNPLICPHCSHEHGDTSTSFPGADGQVECEECGRLMPFWEGEE